VQTPRFCGLAAKAGDLVFSIAFWRSLRTNCEIVGKVQSPNSSCVVNIQHEMLESKADSHMSQLNTYPF
jgi:hypothetical protein